MGLKLSLIEKNRVMFLRDGLCFCEKLRDSAIRIFEKIRDRTSLDFQLSLISNTTCTENAEHVRPKLFACME